MNESATKIGVIEDVSGATVSASLLSTVLPGLMFVKGRGYRIGQPGSFVRVPVGYSNLFGIVSHVGASAIPEKLAGQDLHARQWIRVQLIGEGSVGHFFSRGISQYPTIGDEVHLITVDDLASIYGRPDSPRYVPLGLVASSESVPALLDINLLVTRHSAVVGSTGSGKSTAVASILTGICASDRFKSARVLLFDIHGEYAKAIGDKATVFRIGANQSKGEQELVIPYWALEFDELLTLSIGSTITDDAERGAVAERIRDMKQSALAKYPKPGVTSANLTVDTPVPFSIHKFWLDFFLQVVSTHLQTGNQSPSTVAYEKDAQGNDVDKGNALKVRRPKLLPQNTAAAASPKVYLSQSPLNLRRPLEALEYRLRDARYRFLLQPGDWLPDEDGKTKKDLDDLLRQWLECSRPISIFDLSAVPREILQIVVGALLRIVYDSLFWARNLSEGGRERPLLVVLEEAHAYLQARPDGDTASTRMIKKIVREGRKYGVGTMVVSQRPSEIEPTILSQCGTLFALRLTNSQDRAQVTSAASDNLEGLFSLLPILRTGEALVVGEAVHIPTRVLVEPPPEGRRPSSEDPLIYEDQRPGGWNRAREQSKYDEVVEVWRRQDPTSPSIKDLGP
jgi:uncharacterized protein